MKIESKSPTTAIVTMTGEEYERLASITQELVDVMNKRYEGHTLNEIVLQTSFFIANMSRWFSQQFSDSDGNQIMSEQEWSDLLSQQAKSLLDKLQ